MIQANVTFRIVLFVGLVIASAAQARPWDDSSKGKAMTEEISEGRVRVLDALKELNADQRAIRSITYVENETLSRVFPDQLFYSVIFHQFPRRIVPPAPLMPADLYAVTRNKNGAVRLIASAKDLEEFFKKQLPLARIPAQAEEATLACLELTLLLKQDGYYGFTVQKDDLKVAKQGAATNVSGKAVVAKGGEGEVHVQLGFDQTGKLANITQSATIKAGVRPR
jgi:hypothetical protein